MSVPQGLVLAVETATAQFSVAVGSSAGTTASVELLQQRKHVESLGPAVEFALGESRKDVADLAGVAVDIGPGSYTGIRIGLAFARALGYGRNIPVIPVCSLDALAWGVRHASQSIVAALDAYRGEVFFAIYRNTPGDGTFTQTFAPTVSAPDQLLALLRDERDALLVGDVMDKYAALFESTNGVRFAGPDHKYPKASAVLAVASQTGRNANLRPEPMYMREPYIHPKRREPLT